MKKFNPMSTTELETYHFPKTSNDYMYKLQEQYHSQKNIAITEIGIMSLLIVAELFFSWQLINTPLLLIFGPTIFVILGIIVIGYFTKKSIHAMHNWNTLVDAYNHHDAHKMYQLL